MVLKTFVTLFTLSNNVTRFLPNDLAFLLFQKTMWKEMSFKIKHMEGLPNDKC
jgi:hypothetical protein